MPAPARQPAYMRDFREENLGPAKDGEGRFAEQMWPEFGGVVEASGLYMSSTNQTLEFLYLFYFYLCGHVSVYGSICPTYVSTSGDQRAVDPLELELQS